MEVCLLNCLFPFVGTLRGHLCDCTPFLFLSCNGAKLY